MKYPIGIQSFESIRKGEKYEQSGREQMAEYLAIRGLDEGYLITFDFTGNRIPRQPEWILQDGKRIFEVII